MPKFESTEQLYATLGTTWRKAFEDEAIAGKFRTLGIYVHFIIHEPEGELWLMPDATVHEGAWDGTPDRPEVRMEMKGDIAHRFWLDKLNVPMATAKGDIKAKGPVSKIFSLLPVIKPAKKLFPDIAKANGVSLEL